METNGPEKVNENGDAHIIDDIKINSENQSAANISIPALAG